LNYSQASIANLALGRIGARGTITDLNENTPNAIKVLAVWDAIFQEVLSERDWKFAKIRTELQLSPQRPLYAYRHAWAMPADFLRFVRPHRKPQHDNYLWAWGWGIGWGWYHRDDMPFHPHQYPYVVETLPAMASFVGSITGTVLTVTAVTNGTVQVSQPLYGDGVTAGTFISALGTGMGGIGTYTLNNAQTVASETMSCPNPSGSSGRYLLCDYGGWHGPAKINYIQLITDYTQLMPGFVNCLANRLAAEVSIAITEDSKKFEAMMQMYRDSLNSAEAQNETFDFQKDEAGSESWERAGRYVSWYRY